MVSKVVVHARGALVTREVTLPPELPSGVVDLAVGGITLAAQAGSARAALDGGERVVSAVHSIVFMPTAEHRPGPTVSRLEELTAQRARSDDEHRILTQRRAQLAAVALAPLLRTHDSSKRERDAIDARFRETIAMSRLLGAKVNELDERIVKLERAQGDLARAMEAARLEDVQASTKERMGAAHPTRRIVVRLAGSGDPGRLSITYAVAAARWWPAYTLRMDEGGDRATWTFEAMVAQRTGEDWNAALLALSSADLVFDARLPELPSLRFGRAQPSKKRPVRPAPAGVEEMFAAYLAFRPAPVPRPQPAPAPASTLAGGYDADEEEESTSVFEQAKMKKGSTGGPPPPMAAMPMAAMPMSMSAPGGMMPQMQRMPASARGMPPRAKSAGVFGGLASAIGGGGGHGQMADERGALEDGILAEPMEPELVAGEQWSDLDALVLAGPDDAKRGKLTPRRSDDDAAEGERRLAGLSALEKDRWTDPRESRGMFDHRYDAKGRADVPSDGRVHRVSVETTPCNVLITWRTVPSESPDVYREANVINPFSQALLGGPVDVYLNGSLLAETRTERIDRGGTLWCGMGVDDRVKVARNVRVDEEAAGLLGGSLAVTHTVGIELSSTIKDPIKVVVLERVPVTDDKNVEIKMVKATPPPATYDQSERGSPVRGGCRFDTTVTAGKKLPLEIVYRLTFPSKLDIVGGSRRG